MRFSNLLLFACVRFILGGQKGRGWIQGDREMSGTGEHDVKFTNNKKVKKRLCVQRLTILFWGFQEAYPKADTVISLYPCHILCGHTIVRRETSGNICFPGFIKNLNLFFGNELNFQFKNLKYAILSQFFSPLVSFRSEMVLGFIDGSGNGK